MTPRGNFNPGAEGRLPRMPGWGNALDRCSAGLPKRTARGHTTDPCDWTVQGNPRTVGGLDEKASLATRFPDECS